MNRIHPKPSALLLAVVAVGVPIHANGDDGWMSGEEVRAELIGKTLESKRLGMTMKMTLNEDGTLRAESRMFSMDGTWTVNDDALCITTDSGPMKEGRCTRYRALGEGRYENEEGRTLTAVPAAP